MHDENKEKRKKSRRRRLDVLMPSRSFRYNNKKNNGCITTGYQIEPFSRIRTVIMLLGYEPGK